MSPQPSSPQAPLAEHPEIAAMGTNFQKLAALKLVCGILKDQPKEKASQQGTHKM